MNRQMPRARRLRMHVRALAGAVAVAVLLASARPAMAETLTVEAQGVGATRQEAVAAGLVSALEQVTGVRLEAARRAQQSLSSVIDEGSARTTVSEGFQQEIRQASGGVVRSYQIHAVEEEGRGFLARLTVSVERFAAPGLPTQDRRRLVTMPPQNLAGAQPADVAALRDAITSYFVQTRRFAVLDRENEAAYRSEMALLRSADVPLAETVRIGQMLGADYMLLTKLRRLESFSNERTLPVTGERVVNAGTAIVLDFSILDVATRQIKWAGQAGVEAQGDVAAALAAGAAALGEKVTSGIFPLRVLQVTAGRYVTINQGGDTVRVGQTYTANFLGDEMFDPYTKEPLGRAETHVATIRVMRVDPKLSYGELIAGALPDGADLILRAEAPRSAAQSRPAPPPSPSKPRW